MKAAVRILVQVIGLAAPICTALAADVTLTWDGTTNNWTSPHWLPPLTPPTLPFPNNGNGGLNFDVVIGGGSVAVDQDINIEKLTLSGGVITGTTSFNLTLNSQSTWSGGAM